MAKPTKLAVAFPELRYTFGGRSIVPDISVFRWDRISLTETRRVTNRFLMPLDWPIEIFPPAQSQAQVLSNLLHCIEHASELGWLLDPNAPSRSTLVGLITPRTQKSHDTLSAAQCI